MMISRHKNGHYNALIPVSWSPVANPILRQTPGIIENSRISLVMMNMDPRDIPSDFKLTNVDRSRESIIFERDLAKAIAASRGGFEHTMSVVEPV